MISPFAKRNFVSHVVHEHTSLLKFVETKWNLPAMTYRDANAGNMLEFFDFSGRPPFEHPPKVHAPLNPFVGPLPATSGSAGSTRSQPGVGGHPAAGQVPGAEATPPVTVRTEGPALTPQIFTS